MKKFGFTLAEILITLGIIGVIAAVTANAVKNIVPDKDKVAVLKTYKMIIDANQAILENKRIIASGEDGCDGLECLDRLTQFDDDTDLGDGIKVTGWIKGFPYGILFAYQLHLDGDPVLQGNPAVAGFKTVDSTKWTVGKAADKKGFTITVDFGDDSKCQGVYDKTNCKKPAWFSFYVNNKGYVYGNDPLTTAFLENNETLSKTDVDYKTAEEDTATYRTIKMSTLIK